MFDRDLDRGVRSVHKTAGALQATLLAVFRRHRQVLQNHSGHDKSEHARRTLQSHYKVSLEHFWVGTSAKTRSSVGFA